MERRKPGTRPKGPRHAITARVPDPHWQVYEEAWRRGGYASLNDYVVAVLAERHDLEVPEYAQPGRQQHLFATG